MLPLPQLMTCGSLLLAGNTDRRPSIQGSGVGELWSGLIILHVHPYKYTLFQVHDPVRAYTFSWKGIPARPLSLGWSPLPPGRLPYFSTPHLCSSSSCLLLGTVDPGVFGQHWSLLQVHSRTHSFREIFYWTLINCTL